MCLPPSALKHLAHLVITRRKICKRVGPVSGGCSSINHRECGGIDQFDGPTFEVRLAGFLHAIAVNVMELPPGNGGQLVVSEVHFGDCLVRTCQHEV